jgi:hypothetical protein
MKRNGPIVVPRPQDKTRVNSATALGLAKKLGGPACGPPSEAYQLLRDLASMPEIFSAHIFLIWSFTLPGSGT